MADKELRKSQVIDSLIQGMEQFMTTKTVVGEPRQIGDTIIVPLMDVSFMVGAGSGTGERGSNGAGGMGAKMTPNAILVISGGMTKLINVKNQDTVNKILDMVPDLVNKFTVPDGKSDALSGEDAVKIAFPDEDEKTE